VRCSRLHEDEVVLGKLLGVSGNLHGEPAAEEVDRLLRRMRVEVDRAAGIELRDRDDLMD